MTGVLAVIRCLKEEKYIEKLVLSLLPVAKSIPMRIVDGDPSRRYSDAQVERRMARLGAEDVPEIKIGG